jgi:hypothetical protein
MQTCLRLNPFTEGNKENEVTNLFDAKKEICFRPLEASWGPIEKAATR